ncbi:hypothetical protein SDC9_181262 [bioreactor metagenome]|uniref:FeoB cytosolic helical domain-containing protein n=1 Tax=bioreactor metagenome TaxID=1076179 RepID=A0A645H507_9ZZZZ
MEKVLKSERRGVTPFLNTAIYPCISDMESLLKETGIKHSAFYAAKFFENDGIVLKSKEIPLKKLSEISNEFKKKNGITDAEALSADLRYRYITKLCGKNVIKNKTYRKSTSDKIDDFLTHPILGIPIFLGILAFIFHIAFGENFLGIKGLPTIGQLLQDLAYYVLSYFKNTVQAFMINHAVSEWVKRLVEEGIIGGVGAVLSFIPQIMCLFLFLSVSSLSLTSFANV